MIFAAAALAVSTLGANAAETSGARPIYAVVRVSSSLADEDRIGAKRAGLMCLPNGVIRWGDVATGGVAEWRELVQDALEDAGLPMTPFGTFTGPSGRLALRLRAIVRTAGFKLCAKHYLGDAKAYSGDAALEIEWRLESVQGTEVGHVSQISRHIEDDHAASLGSIYRKLLGDAAADVAHWLQTP